MPRFIFTIGLMLLLFGGASAGIIKVPENYGTIQSGIDAAVMGDTVLVAAGTYYENINFKGKAITVASHFIMDSDTTHINSTLIDGSKPSHADSGSVVYFISGEDTTSILCGFTITNGRGTIIDIGNPAAAYNDPEDASNPGLALFPTRGTVRNDMGAFGGPGANKTITSIKHDRSTNEAQPNAFVLFQNYPNPFNPTTTIEFDLPNSAFVTLKVYNLLGEGIAMLVAEQRAAGIHKFNWDARGLASGVYLYRLVAGDPSTGLPRAELKGSGQVFEQVKKLILMR